MNVCLTAIDVFLIFYHCDINSLPALALLCFLFLDLHEPTRENFSDLYLIDFDAFVTRVSGVMNYVMTTDQGSFQKDSVNYCASEALFLERIASKIDLPPLCVIGNRLQMLFSAQKF